MRQAHGCHVQLQILFEKLFKRPVLGVEQQFDAVFRLKIHLTDYTFHQRKKIILQPAHQAVLSAMHCTRN